MIQINGLTDTQVALLDEMWACDTMEELDEFLDTLHPSDRQQAMQLQRMMLIEALDEDMKAMCEFPAARDVLANIMYK